MSLERVRIAEDDGRRVLLVDNVVQSIAPSATDDWCADGYWAEMVPDHRPEHALLLGVGAGTIVRLLHTRFGAIVTTGVDDDPEVAELAAHELADLACVSIIVEDAFRYVQQNELRFDLVCVDLYRGGQMEGRVANRPFLRRLRAILTPRGHVVFNLFRERRTEQRIERIARVFRIVKQTEVEKNVVVWGR